MPKISQLILGLFAAVVLMLPVKASADPVYTIDWVGMGFYTPLTASLDGHSEATWAGEINFKVIPPSDVLPPGFASQFYAYCADFVNSLQDPESVTVTSSTGFTNGVANGGQKAAWLFDNYADSIHSSVSAAIGNINAAALQIAIWEAMYDATQDLVSASTILNPNRFMFTTAGAIQDQANVYLTALYGNSDQWNTDSPMYTASILDVPLVGNKQYGQDQITRGVPEPATLLVMGLGILLFFQMSRRTLGSMSY